MVTTVTTQSSPVTPAAATLTLTKPHVDAGQVMRFLGLSAHAVVDPATGEASFPPGVLYPYTADLRRVCAAFEAADRTVPDAASAAALLASIATLYSRIGFALGPGAAVMDDAYRAIEKALMDQRPVALVLREASS